MTTVSSNSMLTLNINSICTLIAKLGKDVTEDSAFPSVFKKNQNCFKSLAIQLFDAIPTESDIILKHTHFLLAYIEQMNLLATYECKEIEKNKFIHEFKCPDKLKTIVLNIVVLAKRILLLKAGKAVPEMNLSVAPQIQERLLVKELASILDALKRLTHKAKSPTEINPPLFFIEIDGPESLERLQEEIEEEMGIIESMPDLSTETVLFHLGQIKKLLAIEPGCHPSKILKLCREINSHLETFLSTFTIPLKKSQYLTTETTSTQPKTAREESNSNTSDRRKLSGDYDSENNFSLPTETPTDASQSKETINAIFDMDGVDFNLMFQALPATTSQEFYLELCIDAIVADKLDRLRKFFTCPHFLALNLEELLEINEMIPQNDSTKDIKTKLTQRIQSVISSSPPHSIDSLPQFDIREEQKDPQQRESSPNDWLIVPQAKEPK
jgi:hypothetical protein